MQGVACFSCSFPFSRTLHSANFSQYMYQSPQKKSSSWTPASIQKKSKNFSKPGSSAVPAKRDANSAESQDMPSYSTGAADLLTGSIMRSVETQEHSEVETSTGKRQSEPGRAAVAATAPPIVSIPVVQPNSVGIQAKLTVGAIGDVYEQEADRVAAQVMSMPRAAAAGPQVQRFGEEPSPIGMYSSLARSITPVVQKRVDQQVQMYSLVQRAFRGDGNEASGDLESRLNASKGGGNALAPEVRAFMEPRFGADFSSVRVHTGSEAVQMNRELGAQAFTHRSDIYFGAGKSPGNNELTAHELTHVVQQASGKVQLKGGMGQVGDEYERHADVAGEENQDKSGQLEQLGEALYAINYSVRPPNGDPERPCFYLLEAFEQLANELKRRYDDMLADRHNLFHLRRYESDRRLPGDPDPGSWEGHQNFYDKQRKKLASKLDQFIKNRNCDDDNDPDGYGVRASYDLALEYVDKEPPKQPLPKQQFTLPDWAVKAGARIVDGVLVIPRAIWEGNKFLFGLLLALAKAFGAAWRFAH